MIPILLTLILPSVIAISGAEMRCIIVNNAKKKKIQQKMKQSAEVSNTASLV